MVLNPKTNAEAHESYCRLQIAELGGLYHDLFHYYDDEIRAEFYSRGEDVPNKVFDNLDRLQDLNRRALKFVEAEFDKRIYDFVNACRAVKVDTRPRDPNSKIAVIDSDATFSNVGKPRSWCIRVIDIDGTPYFVGKDVATILGYSDPQKAIKMHIDDEDKLTRQIVVSGQKRNVTLINECGLYSLILSSKLPKAKVFKRWVTSEVIPSIRKHGAYLTPQMREEIVNNPETLITICNQLIQERAKTAQLETLVTELKPKADYYDQVLESPEALPATIIAKDYGMPTVAFNKMLTGKFKVQYKVGNIYVLCQPYAGLGYMITKTETLKNGLTVTHSYWTQKGRCFLYNLLKKQNIVPVRERDEFFKDGMLPLPFDELANYGG